MPVSTKQLLQECAVLTNTNRVMQDNLATSSHQIIEETCKTFNITQRRLAELLGVSEVWICNVKHGMGVLSIDLACRLSNLWRILEKSNDD